MEQNKLLRKLDAIDYLIEHEVSLENFYLIHAFKIKSNINLYENKSLLIDAIQQWKLMNSFLRVKISIVENDKYFSYASDVKVKSCDNLTMLTLNGNDLNEYWRLVYNYEYNRQFVDSNNGLLWRLLFLREFKKDSRESNEYWILFTLHHSIADARHAYYLIRSLFEIIEQLNRNEFDYNEATMKGHKFEPSAMEKLFNNDETVIKNINLKPSTFTKFHKIPESFKAYEREYKPTINLGEFVVDYGEQESIKLDHLIRFDNIEFETKTNGFIFEKGIVFNLLKKCKSYNLKLTGCLNVVTALATRQLYKTLLGSENSMYYDVIQYHSLINLRPFLGIDYLGTGYWAVVFESLLDSVIKDNEDFWLLAKNESDSIHERIRNNDHIESAKLSSMLLDLVKNGVEFDECCTHFALSNLGQMPDFGQDFLIEEHYFGTGCKEKRWTSLVFHGITTVSDNRLCWSITYNSKLIRDDIIVSLIKYINETIELVLN